MDKPESALYDAQTGYIYVSNICGEYFAKDGNGFISRLNLDGSIADLHWVDGLDNPQGLALAGRTLYVADLDHLVAIDIDSGIIVKNYPLQGAQFLNDLTADDLGRIYCSDSRGNYVARLEGDNFNIWCSDVRIQGPNGVLCEGDSCFVLLFDKGDIYKVDRNTQELTLFTTGIANADGMVSDGEGGYFATGAWQGEVFHLNADGEKTLLLNTQGKQTTADITYISEARLLVIPTLGNSVLGYRWE